MAEKILYNRIEKKPKINVWFAHPTIENLALSSVGYLCIFKNLDLMPDVFAERIYTDTKTTRTNPRDVSAFGFSTSFETDILSIINILEKYNIPIKSKDRNENHPLIFGGGPVLSANPLPYEEIYDFISIGDSKVSFEEMFKILVDKRDLTRGEKLLELNKLEYVWVPALGHNKQIKKMTDVLDKPFCTPILSDTSYFKNTFIIEIERGCPKLCNFCLASWLNLPIRVVEYEKIIEAIDFGLQHTSNIALLGAYVAGHPDFDKILDYIKEKNKISPVNLTLSSLRADLADENVVKTLVECGQKTATIAIEAGSEKLRKIINKDLKEEQILKTVKIAREGGLKGLKIYAMLGHFRETWDDIEALLELTKKIKNENKGFEITYSFATFTPKAHTPFEGVKRENTKELENKIQYLKKELHKLGVKAQMPSIAWDNIQAILSRYPKPLTDYFIEVNAHGGNLGAYKQAWKKLEKEGKLPNYEKTAEFPLGEYFKGEMPWRFLHGDMKDMLNVHFNKACL